MLFIVQYKFFVPEIRGLFLQGNGNGNGGTSELLQVVEETGYIGEVYIEVFSLSLLRTVKTKNPLVIYQEHMSTTK